MQRDLDSPRFRSRTARAVVVAILLLDLFVVAAAVRAVVLARAAQLEQASRSTQNLAQALGENLDGTVHLIDLALNEAKAEIERLRAKGTRLDGELETTLTRLYTRVPFLDAIRTASATGRVEHGVGVPPGAVVEIGDRDYFLQAKSTRGDALRVSAPLVSRITGRRSIVLARRTELPDGSFGGVVYAVVTLEQFTRSLARVDIGREGTVALRDKDLVLVARYPERVESATTIGQTTVSPELRAALGAGRTEGTFLGTSPVDHTQKVTTFRRINGGSFLLLVAISVDEFLGGWRAEALRTLLAAALFVLLTWAGARLLLRSWNKEAEERFRTLVENAPIAVTLTRGPQVVYVNRAFVRTLGLPGAEVAIGRSVLDSVAPVDVARTAERLHRRMKGSPVDPTIEITLQRPDGTSFLALVADATVELAGGPTVVGFVQDVTELRRSEADRERLIGELQGALADVKKLSGLLPICAHCKKIRDDRGYWNRIETYIRERSHAEFTHGICPDCVRQFYPEDAAVEGAPAPATPGTPEKA